MSRDREPPGSRAVILFTCTILATIAVVLAGTWYAVYAGNRNAARITASDAVLAQQVRALQRAVTSSCKFNADLAGLPITVSPATGKATLLGVQIVSDARATWRGLGCPGMLPPPSPSFAKWARYYRLPAG